MLRGRSQHLHDPSPNSYDLSTAPCDMFHSLAVVVQGTQRRLATLGRAEVARRAFLRRGSLIGTWADRLPGDI